MKTTTILAMFALIAASFTAGWFINGASDNTTIYDGPGRDRPPATQKRYLEKLAQEAEDDRIWITCQDDWFLAEEELWYVSHGEDRDFPRWSKMPAKPIKKDELKALRQWRKVRAKCLPIERRITGNDHWTRDAPPGP